MTPDAKVMTALRDFTMTVERGEFTCVVGPTGCGKSTTLNLVTGLARPNQGEVRVFGQPVAGISPDIGFVFQADALFPWRSVLDNVAAGPIFRGAAQGRGATTRRADWIARVGLKRFEKHYPHQLSGGMRKRVALAQTFINQPKILLLDEPFSALDIQTRTLMQDELLGLWSEAQASVIFVTHDLEEAIALADKVYVLTAGPATVKAVYTIDLPRPRVTAEIRYEPAFIDYARTDLERSARGGSEAATTRPPRRPPEPEGAPSMTVMHRAPDPRPARHASTEPVRARDRGRATPRVAPAAADRRSRRASAILVAVLGGWELGARFGAHRPVLLRQPVRDRRPGLDLDHGGHQRRGRCGSRSSSRMEETVLGFFIGAVGGVVCGIVLGRNRLLADIFSTYIKVANSIPRVVLGSIFIIALGLGMASKVALAVVMVFFVVFANAFQGVREADRAMIANAQILGASPFQITRPVIIPSAMSWILASLHVSFGFALVGAVVGEFLGAKKGVGLLISTAQGSFNANGVFAAMVILAVLALVVEAIITLVENRLVKWRPVPFDAH